MGNDTSKEGKKGRSPTDSPSSGRRPSVSPRASEAFSRLSKGRESLRLEHLVEPCGSEEAALRIWSYLSNDRPTSESISLNQELAELLLSLMGSSTDIYVKVLSKPPAALLSTSAAAAGVSLTAVDETFVLSVLKSMQDHGSETDELVNWKRTWCPSLCHALQTRFVSHSTGAKRTPEEAMQSEILSPLQFWFLQCALPEVYTTCLQDKSLGGVWSLLYSSAWHGLSVNRFEHHVFDYRGPTVTIFHLQNGQIVILALDTEWRHGSSLFGGQYCELLGLHPVLFRKCAKAQCYANFRLRSAKQGITVLHGQLQVDEHLSGVQAIETWGCAGSNTLEEQRRAKEWQTRQQERMRKVPLPGQWDQNNVDKAILQMAGREFASDLGVERPPDRKDRANND